MAFTVGNMEAGNYMTINVERRNNSPLSTFDNFLMYFYRYRYGGIFRFLGKVPLFCGRFARVLCT